MSLKPNLGVDADTTGASETISISAPTATISSAYYGTPGNLTQVTVAPNQKSITFTVLKGPNTLTINLIAPAPASEVAILYEGSTILTAVTVSNLVGIAALSITGN